MTAERQPTEADSAVDPVGGQDGKHRLRLPRKEDGKLLRIRFERNVQDRFAVQNQGIRKAKRKYRVRNRWAISKMKK